MTTEYEAKRRQLLKVLKNLDRLAESASALGGRIAKQTKFAAELIAQIAPYINESGEPLLEDLIAEVADADASSDAEQS
jgi:hypothetical protein